MTYQVVDWDKHFENDRSRQRKACSFVCVPNKQHGMGFCRVVSHPDGAAIYGIWQMILGACSQQSQPRHGWLTSGGEQAGSAWGASDLAMKFRRPESEVQRALEVLASESIGWLKCHKSPDTHRAVTAQSPPAPPERREEKEEKEEKEAVAAAPVRKFEKPSVETCKLQAAKSGLPEAEAVKFWNYYESNGWRVGKNPMKSWPSAMANWKLSWESMGRNNPEALAANRPRFTLGSL